MPALGPKWLLESEPDPVHCVTSPPSLARGRAPPATVSTTRPTLRPSPAPATALPASGKARGARSITSDRKGHPLQARRSSHRPCPKYPRGRPGRRRARRSDPCRCEVARVARERPGVDGEHECLARNSSGIAFKTREVRAWEFSGCECVGAPWFPLRWILSAVLLHHAHRALADLRGKLGGLVHGSILPRVEASSNPGAIHLASGS